MNRRFVLGGLTGAVLVGLVLVAVLYFADLQITDEQVKVPSLLGDRANVARAKVEALDLKCRVLHQGVRPGSFGLFGSRPQHVTRQLPPSGQTIASGATVTVFVG